MYSCLTENSPPTTRQFASDQDALVTPGFQNTRAPPAPLPEPIKTSETSSRVGPAFQAVVPPLMLDEVQRSALDPPSPVRVHISDKMLPSFPPYNVSPRRADERRKMRARRVPRKSKIVAMSALTSTPVNHVDKQATKEAGNSSDSSDSSESSDCADSSGMSEANQGRRCLRSSKRRRQSFDCPLCHKTFHSSQAYEAHLGSAHNTTMKLDSIRVPSYSHKCLNCGAAFRNRRDLKQHLFTHSKTQPASATYVCFKCKKRFTYMSSFNTHLRTHLETPPKRSRTKNYYYAPVESSDSSDALQVFQRAGFKQLAASCCFHHFF
jgi:DNA-directed RNA polymerase subunit RPC12/RpoP